MVDLNTILASELRQHIQKVIRESSLFDGPPDFQDLHDRAEQLFNVLSAADNRYRRGSFPADDIRAIKAAIDTLPQRATAAGASKQALTDLFETIHWEEYRNDGFGTDL